MKHPKARKQKTQNKTQKHKNTLPRPGILYIYTVPCRLPETTPSNKVLAQILQLRRFNNQLVDLANNIQFFCILEIATCQLLTDTIQDLQGPCILHLGILSAVDGIEIWCSRAVRTRP